MRKDADLTEQEIKEKVDRFFRRDSRIHDSRIRVDVEGRSVRLEGEVRNNQAFRAAENVAYTVMGVKTVDNRLKVVPPETYQKPTDPEIEESVSSTLIWNNQVNTGDLDVVVHDGIVELNGSVDSYHEKKLAGDIAGQLNGVSAVENNLVINSRVEVNDELIADNVFEALDVDPLINPNEINITVDRGVVTLSGSVQDYAAANAAHDALLYIPGVRGIVNQITVG